MTDDEKWKAVCENDEACDGIFFYAVKSTGIYCRPSCKSKLPRRDNICFFETAEQAEAAGFRPCKRCRSDLADYQPLLEIAQQTKALIDTHFLERSMLLEAFATLGLSQHRMVEVFKRQYHLTPWEYADQLRISLAKEQLTDGRNSILDIALLLGFESISSFYAFFRKHTQMTPREYRRLHTWLQAVDSVYYTYDLPIGRFDIVSNGSGITAIQPTGIQCRKETFAADSLTDRAAAQLLEYLTRQRTTFDLPLAPSGTAFQQTVWSALREIPYGETRSYRQVAERIGNPGASRAIGMANNKNPLLIVIPCHRVIGSNGSLVGYAAGLEMKKHLLTLEQTGCLHG